MSLCLWEAPSRSSARPFTVTSMQPLKKADTRVDTSGTSEGRGQRSQVISEFKEGSDIISVCI